MGLANSTWAWVPSLGLWVNDAFATAIPYEWAYLLAPQLGMDLDAVVDDAITNPVCHRVWEDEFGG